MFDTTQPDGTPRKLIDLVQLRALGRQPATPLSEAWTTAFPAFHNGMRA